MSSKTRLQDYSGEPISGHKGRDKWMCALAAASDLSTLAMRLAFRLCVAFNCKTGQCDPGYPTLAEGMAVSERSVFRAVAELEAGGWIAVGRTGGNNTRKNQFTLLIPSKQVASDVTTSGDNMVSPEAMTSSGDNMMSPEAEFAQVTENATSGDRNSGFQVTDRLAGQKNLITCEPEIAAEGGGYHTSRAVRDSASNSTAHDATNSEPVVSPVPRAEARTEPITARQPKPSRDNPIGAATNGADAAQPRERACVALWRAYPNQTYEGDAPTVFRELLDEGVDPDVLIAGAAAYAKRCEGIDPKNIKLLCYWLRVKGWDHENSHLLQTRL